MRSRICGLGSCEADSSTGFTDKLIAGGTKAPVVEKGYDILKQNKSFSSMANC